MNLRSVNHYVEGRAFEWAMSLGMIAAGGIFVIWPVAAQQSALTLLMAIFSEYALGLAMIIIGWSRLASLMLNGQKMFRLKLGPYVRAVGGVLSAMLWVQFVVALVFVSIERGYPSPGIPFWFMFTLAELYSAYTTVKNG